ncbi:MAG: DUF481 domain-containing protein [Gemmataceae bacterium]
MLRRGLALAAGLVWVAVVAAQPVPPPPPGGFNFDPPKAAPAAPPPPVIPNDGLFPTEPPPKIWSGGGEVGVNGADGNSQLFTVRAGLRAQRKTADNLMVTDFLYTYARQNGAITQDQALFNGRDEILFAGTPWSLFAATNIEYDNLRAYDFLVGVYGGVGYQLLDDDVYNWRVRAGAGAVRQIGGPADRWVPEMVFGTDFNWKITDRQSFLTVVDYYPRIDNWSQFRVRARAAYQILLDPEYGIVLRLGVQNRYDSDPGPAKRNDVTYFGTLGFAF